MKIFIKCSCKSVFSFEETPVNDRVVFPVTCPSCGTDCTEKANAFIAYKKNAADHPVQQPKGWRRVFMRRKKNEFQELESSKDQVCQAESDSVNGDETSPVRLGVAAAGALAAGLAGAVGWFYLAKATGFQFGIVAWVLGSLVGGASYFLAPRGHHFLGLIAAIAAVIAIGGGQYLVAKWAVNEEIEKYVPAAYVQALNYATEASIAKSEADLRRSAGVYKLSAALGDHNAPDALDAYQTAQLDDSALAFIGIIPRDDHPKLTFAERAALANENNVTPGELARFKTEMMPALKALAAGNPSSDSYQESLSKKIRSRITFNSIFVQSINPYSLLWICLGIVTAYKLARNPALSY